MSQQVNLFSGTSFRGFPIHLPLPKSIDWKVAACFSLIVGSLIVLALRFMRQAPNNSLGHSTTGPDLSDRIDQHSPVEGPEPGSQEEKSPISAPQVTTSSTSAPKSGASTAVSASKTSSPAVRDGWTINTVEGEITASFSMNSNDVVSMTKQIIDRDKAGIDCRRALKSETFIYKGEEYCLSFSQKDEDFFRICLEKTSDLKKASLPSVTLRYVYILGNNPVLAGTSSLDFSHEKSQIFFTTRRFMRVAGGATVTLTVTFLKPETT